jgi:signal transduction histidine kinase
MNSLPWMLVALGLVLLLAAWAVWHRGRRVRRCLAELLALPADMHPLRWPERAWPILERSGIAGIAWEGVWFGDAVHGQWGQPLAAHWPRQTLSAGPDCQIELRWADVARTDEARVLALAVLDVFAQTWLSRMRERTQAVAVALAQRAQVQLYWQHDMRNLAQWVGLLAEEFGAATPAQLPRLAQRLQRQAPLLQARAHKLLAATEAPTQAPAADEPPVQALDLLHNAAELAGLAIDLGMDEGSAPALLAPVQAQALERALDNIFSNLARDSGARHGGVPLRCECTAHEGALQARLHTPRLATPWPRRAFEPLKSPSGSGMGLYQARRSLRDAGGDLQASEEAQGVVFVLCVPLATSECAAAGASRNLTVAGHDASAQ